jgi:regulator of replication initiation timing
LLFEKEPGHDMSFAILHMEKLKQPAIKGIQIHNQREKESQTNGDIDDSRSHLNYDLVNHKQIDYSEKINKMIEEGVTTGKTIRKDAVKVASFLVTSDSEYFEGLSAREEKRFFESAYEFFADEYGEKNLAFSVVHKDEKTPHMHVGFVPITEDGRLSAKDFFGKKQQLVKLQDKFHEYMKREGFDLERGVSSDRKHVESAKYKALTFQKMEQEARESYERTKGHIHQIDDKTKSIESIEGKKMLGYVGLKQEDYESLKSYATKGLIHATEAKILERELEETKSEMQQLKSDMQVGQAKVRDYYKDIDANFDAKVTERLRELDVVKQYNDLVGNFNKLLGDNKNLKQQVGILQEENKELILENKSLMQGARKALRKLLTRIINVLERNNVAPPIIKFFKDNRDQIVEDSMKELTKPIKDKGMELE